MKFKKLNPEEIITLADYPIRVEQILKLYYWIYRKAYSKIPPCPVLSEEKVLNKFDKRLLNVYYRFKENHPKAKYFLLDGSHKTTAGALSRRKIPAMVLETNADIKKSEKMVDKGDLISLRIGKNMKGAIKEIRGHHKRNEKFWTVAEKTKKLVKDKKVPKYMIEAYLR